ncbi:hypothetical protein [Ralstonia pseudosolanacearum]|uniref:hypothetical protein n=1 Tax=Ralstonia pseudosolanacearum TaxID=1310165 RepID=UPI0039C6F7C0
MRDLNTNTPQQNPVQTAAEAAARELGFHEHRTPGFQEAKLIPREPVGSASVDLSRALSLAGASGDVHAVGINLVPAGETAALSPQAIIEQHSRVAAAGAKIIIAARKPAPSFGTQPAFYSDAGLLRHVTPAAFNSVADGADVGVSPLPVTDVAFGWATTPHQAARFQITRAQHRAVGGDQLHDAVMTAILAGIGELCDRLFLQAVLAATPVAFTMGKLAARHAKFDEARALIGTNGAGAEIAGDGSLRAAGVFAELTAASTATLIGLFQRGAVALRPELDTHIRRLNANGDVEVVCFATAQPVVTDAANDFWTVA